MTEDRTKTLVNRLRGIYDISINDGAGPIDGSMIYTRDFGNQGSLQSRAAETIERLEKGKHIEWGEINILIAELVEPDDPMGIGKKFIVPIRREAAQRIYDLRMKLDPLSDIT